MVILRFRKIVLHNRIIDKTRSKKNQENSAHRFGDNYLTNHLVKFWQDRIKPWRVGALTEAVVQRCSVKNLLLEISQKFTGKQVQACNFIKRETLAQVFSCEFCKISKNTFFTEHLWWLLLLLDHALAITFIVSEGFLTSFNFSRGSC